jgi:hypothetical protein
MLRSKLPGRHSVSPFLKCLRRKKNITNSSSLNALSATALGKINKAEDANTVVELESYRDEMFNM